MKNRYILLLLSIGLMLPASLMAQENSAGRCYSVDYPLWNANQKDIHGNCGTSDVFNTGNEITLEAWVRAYTFGENRKIMGKKAFPNLDNNGYVFGYQNLNVYTEISNPEKMEITYSETGSMPVDSAWVHIATTYSANGHMVDYINGDTVGYMQIFPPNPIAASDGEFIIGRAPWGYSFLFYGDLDEIRVWNVQRSHEEIKASMFSQLSGSENGLIAYYNFNQANGSTFYDQSPSGNNGVINEFGHESFDWAPSYAPIGDETMRDMHNVQAAWCGKQQSAGFNLIDTLDGLSFVANIQQKEFKKYLVAGHNNLSGTTQDLTPQEAPVDFKRLNRVWYVNQGGDFTTSLVFDLKKSAADGDTLAHNQPDSLYTLLKLDDSGRYEPVYSANMVNFSADGYSIVFQNVDLSDGFYTVGVGSERLAFASSVKEIASKTSNISIYPNPAKDYIIIKNSKGAKAEIFNISGRLEKQSQIYKDTEMLKLENFESGIYLIKITTDKETVTTKILIQ